MIFYSRTRLLNARRDKVDRSCSRRRNGEKTLQLETDFLNVKVLTIFVLLFLSFFQNCLAQDGANSISDERCFLQAGGSTASFFVKEDLAVGSLVGQLRIKGDVGENINLTLTPDDGPLRIENQDLILTRPLDKEGIDGPSFINVDVTCHRLQTFDPGFTVPVIVRVTDVNDNTPNFIDAPYHLNISELTIVGSRIFRNIKAVDADQPGPFSTVEYSIGESQYSDYVAFENPLDGSLVLTKNLDYETLKSFQVRILAKDQGAPSRQNETLLTINVQDADDQNPAFFYERYDALLPEGNTEIQKLMVQPQELKAFDKDDGLGSPIFYTFSGNTDEYKYFELNRNTGHIYITSNIPETEFLQPVTLVVQATQFDNPDRYAVTTLTVTRGGIFDSDLQFVQHYYQVKVLENVPLNSVVTTLLTNKPSSRKINFEIDKSTLPGNEFTVSQKGDVILRKTLDFEIVENFSFVVKVTDGRRNDSARVNVSVININDWDPRFKYPQYEFFVDENDVFDGFVMGTLEVFDGDKGDKISLELRGPFARIFDISRQGELIIKDIRLTNVTEAHVVVVAKDSGIPPRETSVPVVVHFPNHRASELKAKEDEAFTLMVVFGLVLSVLFIVIVLMAAYICKQKQKRSRQSSLASISQQGSQSSSGYNNNIEQKAFETASTKDDGSATYNFALVPANSGVVQQRLQNGSSMSLLGTHSVSAEALALQNRLGGVDVALNPLNPRSRSQRRYLSQTNVSRNNRISPTAETPLPSPSIHEVGLPEVSHTPQPHFGSATFHPGSIDDVTRRSFQRGSISELPNSRSSVPRGSADDIISSRLNIQRGSIDENQSRLQQTLKENILGSSDLVGSRIEWPRNSISRRVKKLSWEDENADRDISTLTTNPNFSIGVKRIDDEDDLTTTSNEPHISGRAIYF